MRVLVCAAALVLLLVAAGCGADEAEDGAEAVSFGRAQGLADVAAAELREAGEMLRAARSHEGEASAEPALRRLEAAGRSLRLAAERMDAVVSGLADVKDPGADIDATLGEDARAADVAAGEAERNGIVAVDEVVNVLQAGAEPVSNPAHVAIVRASDAVGEAAQAASDAADAVDAWLGSASASEA